MIRSWASCDNRESCSPLERPINGNHGLPYRATALEQMRELYVYTPPDYQTNRDRSYPVLYLLHGGGQMDLQGIRGY